MKPNCIRYEMSESVARIVKNNPPQYGMTKEMLIEMKWAIEDAGKDSDISVVVISADGDGFQLGATVFGEMENKDWNLSPLEWRDNSKFAYTLFRAIETLEKPVIRVAKTGAVGGGLENLHACDFVTASENAKFSQPEVNLGLIAGWGGTQRLTRLVGWRKARELLLTGVEIDGKEAEAIGIISNVMTSEMAKANTLDNEENILVDDFDDLKDTAENFSNDVKNTVDTIQGEIDTCLEYKTCLLYTSDAADE